ncbi:hypothetical protein [Aureimonas mangrovi]|uniref:hypothetical protein n=1 Tax=Aureimonas mangrovi TaxID=2758041 RepID=UPI00163D6956|nr:hypothetical protein [Aureimonas mangrovi]
MNARALLVGLAAGLASALLFAGLVTQSVSALGLSLAAPIPILIASLGWGSAAGIAAALVSAGVIAGITGTPAGGLMILATIGAPAAFIGHLCGLARPSDDPQRQATPPLTGPAPVPLDWYPLDRVLFAAALSASAGCLVMGWLIGYDAESAVPMLQEALSAQAGAGLDIDDAQIEDLSRMVVSIVPFVQPAVLTLTLCGSLYLAAAITRLSGRLQRPKDDIPSQAGLPRLALPIFAVALAISFLEGALGNVAAVFAGALGAAFTLVGLAAFHHRTRGRSGRGLLLFTVYFAIVVLTFPIFAFLVYGVFKAARPGVGTQSSN